MRRCSRRCIKPARRRERQRRGARLPQWRGAGDGQQSVVRSVAVQFRRVAGAVGRVGVATSARRCSTGRSRACMRLARPSRWRWRWRRWSRAASRPGDIVPLPRVFRPRQRAVPLLAQGRPRLARSARRPEEQLRRVSSTRWRRRVGIDRIAAMAHRLGLGHRAGDRPARRASGADPDARVAAVGHGHPWNLGDTVVAGIGQGFIQVTPLQLATYAARVATGRKVEPHLTRKIGGELQPGSQASDWPALGLSDRFLHVVREGMWAVVNEPGGTAPLARLPDQRWQMAGKTGSSQVRRVSREQREQGNFDSSKLPWEYRPHALFVAYRALRRAALRRVGGGGARQCRRRGGGADGARHHAGHAAARSCRARRTAGGDRSRWRPIGAAMREGRLWRETSFDLGARSGRSTGCTCCCCARWPASATPRCTASPAVRRSHMHRATCCASPPAWC